jgi:hypothetical protein
MHSVLASSKKLISGLLWQIIVIIGVYIARSDETEVIPQAAV